jgi:hypothetical protein
LVYSTFLGGNSSKTHVDGGTSRFDKYGIVYHAVCSGCAFGTPNSLPTSDFPTTPHAKSRANGSQNCNNAAFKFDLSSLKAAFDTNNMALTMPGYNNVCYPDSIVFENMSIGGKTITWNFGDGTIVNKTDTDPKNLIHKFQQMGQYYVKLKITDLSTCSQTDSVTKIINYYIPNIVVGNGGVICEGTSFQLIASGGVTYKWTNVDGTFSSSEQSPIVQPKIATIYIVTAADAHGCSKTDSIGVGVKQNVHSLFQTYKPNFSKPGYNNVCYPDPIQFKNQSLNGENYVWNFDDGTTLTKTNVDTVSIIHSFTKEGGYKVKLKAVNPITCNRTDSIIHTIHYFKSHLVVGNDGEICEGTTFLLTAKGASVYTWSADDHAFSSSNPSPLVQPASTTQYFVAATDANGCFGKDTIKVTVVKKVDLKWQHLVKANCIDRPSIYVKNLIDPADSATFHFDFGDGATSMETEVEHAYENDGTYFLKFMVQKKICSFEETVQLPMYKLLVPNVFTPDDSPGANDYFKIVVGKDKLAPTDLGITVQLIVVNKWGKRVFESTDYKNNWNAQGVAGGTYYFQVKMGDVATCKDWLEIMK